MSLYVKLKCIKVYNFSLKIQIIKNIIHSLFTYVYMFEKYVVEPIISDVRCVGHIFNITHLISISKLRSRKFEHT